MSDTDTRSGGKPSLKGLGLPARIPFAKMHGLGNDYVYVATFNLDIAAPSELAIHISDRHFGVGGDGLVLICRSDVADFRMRMFNADGSEAEMCGNAIRCVGKYLFDNRHTDKTELSIETLAGIRHLVLTVADGVVRTVRVDMGKPRLAPRDIPLNADGESFINQPVEVDGKTWLGTAVSVGNPHLVVPVADVMALDLERIGPLFENLPLFPKRVNTEFVQVNSADDVCMRVWERGSGETMACGTGACATLVACALNNLTGRRATVRLLGGDLHIEWAEDDTIFMTGPATLVATGEYFLPHF